MYCLHLFYHLNVTMLQCYNVAKTVNQNQGKTNQGTKEINKTKE